MHRLPKLLRHALGQIHHAQVWLGFQEAQDKRHDVVGELVRPARPFGLGKQPRQPRGLEALAQMILRDAGEAKGRGCASDRLAFDHHPPQHFVFDLNQIACIEEGMTLKQRIGDLLGMRIESGSGAQDLALGIGPRRRAYQDLSV